MQDANMDNNWKMNDQNHVHDEWFKEIKRKWDADGRKRFVPGCSDSHFNANVRFAMVCFAIAFVMTAWYLLL